MIFNLKIPTEYDTDLPEVEALYVNNAGPLFENLIFLSSQTIGGVLQQPMPLSNSTKPKKLKGAKVKVVPSL